MNWRTETKIEPNKGFLKYEHSSTAIGSCFADEIGERLKSGGFDISVNPFGVIFNPVSILQLIQNALDGNVREDLIFSRDMKFFHYGYHSSVFGSSEEDLTKNIEGIQYNVQRRLVQGNKLFLTFGSAWAYRLIDNAIVANCHKMPANLFTKELIDLEKLERLSEQLFTRLFEENPNLEVMITVSPVRHVKDGLYENNLSKSVLHLFSQYLTNKFTQISYFPAYELVVDDLRDYRYYKEDLIHPNKQAIDYVFDRFRDSQFDQQTEEKFMLHEKIRKAEVHHFLNATLEEIKKHEDYIVGLKDQLATLSE